mmetsp:Transcript_33339/g.81859  ORF Transcript_33339/g.81859 Transcript_33339/m.81859 type:complete len:224 (-) Transcript_33339:1006-1677(-)
MNMVHEAMRAARRTASPRPAAAPAAPTRLSPSSLLSPPREAQCSCSRIRSLCRHASSYSALARSSSSSASLRLFSTSFILASSTSGSVQPHSSPTCTSTSVVSSAACGNALAAMSLVEITLGDVILVGDVLVLSSLVDITFGTMRFAGFVDRAFVDMTLGETILGGDIFAHTSLSTGMTAFFACTIFAAGTFPDIALEAALEMAEAGPLILRAAASPSGLFGL